MSCCLFTYDLGCIYYCNQLKFGEATFTGEVTGIFLNGNHAISQTITVEEGGQFMFDMSYLNENMEYSLSLYVEGVKISLDIAGIEYDCFRVKTEIIGISVDFTPLPSVDAGVVVIVADGGAIYTNATLIGKDIQLVFTDNVIRIPSDYSFDTLTGTITFISDRDSGEILQITYI